MAGWIRLFGCIFAIPEKAIHRHVSAAHCMTPSKQSVKVDPCLLTAEERNGWLPARPTVLVWLPSKERDLSSSHSMLSSQGT